MNKIKLNINNREISFHLGLGFLGELLDNRGISVNDVFEKLQTNPFKLIPIMMYESVLYSAIREGKELDFTEYDLVDWLSAEGVGSNNVVTESFLTAFSKSMTKDVPKSEPNKEEEGEVKKK